MFSSIFSQKYSVVMKVFVSHIFRNRILSDGRLQNIGIMGVAKDTAIYVHTAVIDILADTS